MPSPIKESAIKSGDKVYTGRRHHNIIQEMRKGGCPRSSVAQANQGFITLDGIFLTREQALSRAVECGQVIMADKKGNQNQLFSEDYIDILR